MKKKNIIQIEEPIPLSCYIVLFIVFISIVYLIVLRKRVDELFTDTPPPVSIKNDINPSEIEKVWEGKLDTNKYLSIWQRKTPNTQDYYRLGQYALVLDYPSEALPDEVIPSIPILNMLAKGGQPPISYVKIWSSDLAIDKPPIDMSIWQAVPPHGYSALSDVIVPSLSPPSKNTIVCLPNELLTNNGQIKEPILKYDGEHPMSLWTIGNYNAFMGNQNNNSPDIRKNDIFDIKQDTLDIKEIDPTESYTGITVQMKTF